MAMPNKTKFKNIFILILTVAEELILITVFSYIQRQNKDYQKKDKELLIKQQQEEERLREEEENIEGQRELPELQEERRDQIDSEYPDDTIRII